MSTQKPSMQGVAERLAHIAEGERVAFSELRFAVIELFSCCGLAPDDAELAAEAALYPQLSGLDSHGVATMPLYVRGLLDGTIRAAPNLVYRQNLPAAAQLDADNGLGLVVGPRAMQRTLELAAVSGVGAVAVRNSSHFGSAGYYARQAADAGMIGLAFSNAAPAIAPSGGTKAVLGTNPIGAGAPIGGSSHFVVDMALTTVARSKLRQSLAQGETSIPEGWAIDADGRPTTDTAAAIAGSLLPIGGPKGYGLAVLVELLCSGLSDGRPGFDITYEHMVSQPSRVGHFFLAIDPAGFAGRDAFSARATRLSEAIAASPPADPAVAPRLPGARGETERQARLAEGIPVGSALSSALLSVAQMLRGH